MELKSYWTTYVYQMLVLITW